MKIYDKTPLQNENGEIEFFARLRGTLKYGFSWYPDLQAQKVVIAKLEKLLERNFVLIRNFTLPKSEIIIPIILIGLPGIQIINVSDIKGFFEAKGSEWNIVNNGRSQPASDNLLNRTVKFSRNFQRFLQYQKIELPCEVEPVLICANPGAHLDALRPAARVVKSDAINAFAAALLQAAPVLQTAYIHDLADHIVNPRPAGESSLPAPAESAAAVPESSAPARARAIFEASQEAEPVNPADLEFALREEARAGMEIPAAARETSPAQLLGSTSSQPQASKPQGMSARQIALLAFMALVECVVLAAFGALLYFNR